MRQEKVDILKQKERLSENSTDVIHPLREPYLAISTFPSSPVPCSENTSRIQVPG